MSQIGSLVALAIVAVVAAVLFIILRQVSLWYFRLNEIVELLQKIAKKGE